MDGLNKELDPWDTQYYMGEFRSLCAKEKMTELAWPVRDYVVQVARFDPSKGIPNVIDSYAKFRELLKKEKLDGDELPQLLICGHGAVDDPDASIIYDQVLKLIHSEAYSHLAKDIVVMRVPPSDQRILFFTISRVHLTYDLNSSQCAHGQREDRVTVVHTRRLRSQGF